ncbi:ligase-associated DNA damage response endonuclease PdeM [Pseudaquabacterium pictum]|uniref:DEAD/DEAH box helicase n=1 Tax=Pseudaquabacterium pictum TaxID=2315236 RepID=A0A480AQH0_9BURK|nr:ligase-associated DNA damage response endonuclease PdeM [Rubrivivax pictus]GCL62332.1 DEAD/DEAH box helicase [Rubrivivax pictus]
MSAAAVVGVQPAWFTAPGGGRLQLWPQKAAFDPDLGLLLVADAHLGKAVSFRRLGVPVPEATTAAALDRLDALLVATGARGIVFLGDLLHSARAHAAGTMATVAAWRARHPALELTLVRGNHDAHAGDPPPALGVQVVDGPLRLGPWALQHEPAAVPGAYALAGHVHPGVVLTGRGGDRLRLPCFHFGPAHGVLPAFGPFTGLHILPADAGVRQYAVAGEVVQALPGTAGGRAGGPP